MASRVRECVVTRVQLSCLVFIVTPYVQHEEHGLEGIAEVGEERGPIRLRRFSQVCVH